MDLNLSFKQFLAEMPLGHYAIVRDDERKFQKAFNKKDQVALTNNKNIETLKRILLRTGYVFNIILFPAFTGRSDDRVLFDTQVKEYLKTHNIPTEGRITFVKNATSGGGLTPWMLLHTLGHALLSDNQFLLLKQEMKEIFNQIGFKQAKNYSNPVTNMEAFTIHTMVRLTHFRSARAAFDSRRPSSSRLNNIDELIHELVAEYLWHGGTIRLYPNDNAGPELPSFTSIPNFASIKNFISIDYNRSNKKILSKPINIPQPFLDERARKIESIITEMLDYMVGKIIYDYFAE